MKSKVLVTGGAGFIGSHIAEELLEKGHEVIVYDNLTTGSIENLEKVKNHIEFVRGDILNFNDLQNAMKGVDIVSHHAAQLEIFRGTDDPEYDLDINTKGTLNVLKAAKNAGVEKIINASSACIYGQVEGPTAETHYPRPNWTYGVSKLAAEKYCHIYSDYHGLPVVNLRYGITYGEREWYRRVLTIFVKRAVSDQPLVVFGDGSQIRDFIYVGDAVRCHNICMDSDKANGQSYNVGTGMPTTIEELAQKVVKASGKNLEIIFEETPEGACSKLVPGKRRNAEELKVMLLNIEKAKRELDWQPLTELQDGLKNEIQWATANLHRWKKVLNTA